MSVVATPARAAEDLCRFSEGAWRRGTFSKNVTFIRHVVFDEADQLLSGGYLRPVRGIFDVLYREEKLAALGLTVDAEEDDESGNEKEPGWSGDAARGVDADARDWRLDHRDVNHEKLVKPKAQISGKGKGPALGGKGGVGVGAGRAFRRQYAFAAATVMSNGKKTPGAMIKYGFPDAVWVEGRRLHRAVPNVTQTWINVSDTSRADALGAALGLGTEGFRPDVDCAKTMVFVNSAEACEAVAAELKRQGFKAEAFGAQCTNSERAERLRAFADGSVSVLACTDAAARGVDVPGVAHVVQAEFAGNAGRVSAQNRENRAIGRERVGDEFSRGEGRRARARRARLRKQRRGRGGGVFAQAELPQEVQEVRRNEDGAAEQAVTKLFRHQADVFGAELGNSS
jgi:superfamily II DNA/RNA helicase